MGGVRHFRFSSPVQILDGDMTVPIGGVSFSSPVQLLVSSVPSWIVGGLWRYSQRSPAGGLA